MKIIKYTYMCFLISSLSFASEKDHCKITSTLLSAVKNTSKITFQAAKVLEAAFALYLSHKGLYYAFHELEINGCIKLSIPVEIADVAFSWALIYDMAYGKKSIFANLDAKTRFILNMGYIYVRSLVFFFSDLKN
jgi:hypothetical protein